MRGAHPVAVSDRGQALHRGAEQLRERLRLGLAQLRELRGRVSHRAVVLAELVAAGLGLGGRGGVPLRRQSLRQHLHALVRGHRPHGRLQPLEQARHLLAGEVGHGFLSHAPGQESQRAPCQVVIGVLESTAPRIGDREQLGRPSAPALTARADHARLDHPLGHQGVEVTPDGGGREPEPLAQGGGRDGTMLQDQPGDTGARAALAAWLHRGHVFFTTSVCRNSFPVHKRI
ncbi:hypothetical protein GCM10020001_008250 [Nonomuraea salmonea]